MAQEDCRDESEDSSSALHDSLAESDGFDDVLGHNAYGTSPATSGTNQSPRGKFVLKPSLFSAAQRDLGSSESSSEQGEFLQRSSFAICSSSTRPRDSTDNETPRLYCRDEDTADLYAQFTSICLTPPPDISAWLQKLPPRPAAMKTEIFQPSSLDLSQERSEEKLQFEQHSTALSATGETRKDQTQVSQTADNENDNNPAQDEVVKGYTDASDHSHTS